MNSFAAPISGRIALRFSLTAPPPRIAQLNSLQARRAKKLIFSSRIGDACQVNCAGRLRPRRPACSCAVRSVQADAVASTQEEGGGKAKVAVVTGGSRGIGRAICLKLAIQEGYTVAVNYSSNSDAADAVVAEIIKAGGIARPFQADISKQEDVGRMFDEVCDSFGSPRFLVNNAGVLGPGSSASFIGEVDVINVYNDVFSANVLGPLLCTQEFVQRYQADGSKTGAIVNISSGSAIMGRPLIYGMSKGAINSMLAGLVPQLAPLGIRVNNVAPGMTRTDMITEDMINSARPTIPLDRAGEPEEIASVVAFLLSENASYTSGANVRVAGGRP